MLNGQLARQLVVHKSKLCTQSRMVCKRRAERFVHQQKPCAEDDITLEVIKLQKEPRELCYALMNMDSQICAEWLFLWFLPKGLMCCVTYYIGFFFSFFNSRSLWNPFLECQRLLQFPELLSQPKPDWAQRWMTCHPKADPYSSLNGAGDAGTPLMKLPPKVMRL